MFFRSLSRLPWRGALPSLFFALAVTIGIAGCNTYDPSQWTQEQVAKDISEQWNLVDVDLAPAEGGYTGSGKNSEGETFAITVKLDRAAKSATYECKGDRGTELHYSVRAEPVP